MPQRAVAPGVGGRVGWRASEYSLVLLAVVSKLQRPRGMQGIHLFSKGAGENSLHTSWTLVFRSTQGVDALTVCPALLSLPFGERWQNTKGCQKTEQGTLGCQRTYCVPWLESTAGACCSIDFWRTLFGRRGARRWCASVQHGSTWNLEQIKSTSICVLWH